MLIELLLCSQASININVEFVSPPPSTSHNEAVFSNVE